MEVSETEKDKEESESPCTSPVKPLKPDRSGPFMSLILHRLDPKNLPRVTSESPSNQDESDNVQTVSSGEDSDEEVQLVRVGKEWEGKKKQRMYGRYPRRVKQRSSDESDSDKSSDATPVRRSSRNCSKKMQDFTSLFHDLKETKRKQPSSSGEESSDSDIRVRSRRPKRNSGDKPINYDERHLKYPKSDSEAEQSESSGTNNVNSSEESNGKNSYSSSDVSRDSIGHYKRHSNKKVKKESHLDYCCVCQDGGDLLCCDSCIHVFHLSCIDPPLTSMPKGSWKCCACSVDPLDKVDRIFTWKKKGYGRELFVHFAGKSYWQCRWVPETQLQFFQPGKVQCFYKKHGKHEPPNLDEGDARRLRKNNQDPLEIRFYQNGVRPEWLRINRIIDHQRDSDENLSYLVKWQQLGYDSATWEDEDSCKEITGEFSAATRVYHEWLNLFWDDPGLPAAEKPFVYKHLVVPPKKPISNLRRKLEKQPDYIPRGMVLHDYQLEGLNWLRYSWAKRTNTILGDEMGLGKTIQTIVFLNSLYKEGHCQGPFLISAPLSTLLNWEREFEAWAPEMYVVTYTGDQDTRLLIRKTEFVKDSSSVNKKNKRIRSAVKFHVLLTSYQFPTMDAACLGSIPWEMIIVDEGHRLKDDGTLLFKDLMSYTTSYKLLLTGTPLQNNLEELFNLLNFLCPEKFQDVSAFLTEFEDIAKEDQIKKLHTLLGPHLLRRMKVDVLKDMPSKSELIVRVELSPMQKEYSKHILMKNYKALNYKGGRQTSLQNVFVDLRKICNHPYLFSKASVEAPEDPETGLYELKAMTEASGKLVMLRKMLERLKKQGHRVLIFSQMTTMLDILEEFIENLGYTYERIDGNVTGSVRQDSIDRFNAEGAEQFVFLLSTKAGGLGINLATADTVIIYDSDWNPHNDIQAFSRAHRIGQKNKVMIYRFVTHRSVEEKMVEVCKKKMMLTHLVVRPEVGKTNFSRDEMQDIIRFGTEELFKDKGVNAPIYYTDSMIEAILDRTQEEVSKKSDCNNDFFQGFKVANCEVDDDVIAVPSLEESKDPDQWKYLLRQEIKKNEEAKNDLTNYGKGKRKRPTVKYAENNATEEQSVTAQKIQNQNNVRLGNPSGQIRPHSNYMEQLMKIYPNIRLSNPSMGMGPLINYGNQPVQMQPNAHPLNRPGHVYPNVNFFNRTGQVYPNLNSFNRPGHVYPNVNFFNRTGQVYPNVNPFIRPGQVQSSVNPSHPPGQIQSNLSRFSRTVQMQPRMLNPNPPIHRQPLMGFGNVAVRRLQPSPIGVNQPLQIQPSTGSAYSPVQISPNEHSSSPPLQDCIEETPRSSPKSGFKDPPVPVIVPPRNVRKTRERNSANEVEDKVTEMLTGLRQRRKQKEIICIDLD